MSVEITGLSGNGKSVSVDDDLTVTPSADAGADDVMAQMRAAVGQDEPAKSDEDAPAKPADDAPVDDKPVEDKPAAGAGDKPAEEKPVDEKADEQKPADDKPADDKPADAESPAEASEAEKVVDEVGGVEVIKAAQPFIEAVYDVSLPVSERLDRLEQFVPKAQMEELRNELFWQAVAADDVRDVLTKDEDVREVFAQKVFGIPFAYLQQVITEDKELIGEDGLAEAIAQYAKEPAEKPEAKAPLKAEEKPPLKTEEKKPGNQVADVSPEFKSEILDPLAEAVDRVFATGDLEIKDGDDEATKQFKSTASAKFVEDWPKVALSDEPMAKTYKQMRELSDKGMVDQAKQLLPRFTQHAERVAVKLLDDVSKELTAHRGKVQAKGKAAAGARTESAGAAKSAAVDVSALKSEKDVERAMNDFIASQG